VGATNATVAKMCLCGEGRERGDAAWPPGRRLARRRVTSKKRSSKRKQFWDPKWELVSRLSPPGARAGGGGERKTNSGASEAAASLSTETKDEARAKGRSRSLLKIPGGSL